MTERSEITSPPARRAPAPAGVKLLRFLFSVVGPVLPGMMTGLAYNLWFRTRRMPHGAHERRVLDVAEREMLDVGGKRVATYAWGRGPVILLVHGWHGTAAHFADFISALTDAGFRAVALDAPAHGASPGGRTTLPEIVNAIERVSHHFGPVCGVVAHSFGAMCTTSAIAQHRLAPKAVVCIGAPLGMEGLFISFTDTLGLPLTLKTRMRAMFQQDFGEDIWTRYSPETHAPGMKTRALIVHDNDDRSVPVEEGVRLANLWSGADLMRTQRLGHRRILADPAVIQRVTEFLTRSCHGV